MPLLVIVFSILALVCFLIDTVHPPPSARFNLTAAGLALMTVVFILLRAT
jgi:hypothetical protein